MNNLKISIITVCFNSEDTITRTIESVLNQTYDNYEYFIIDGKSTDNTVTIAESYYSKFSKRGVKYVVISEPDNGMYDALNKGCRLASGDVIGQINSDDWYEPNALNDIATVFFCENCDMIFANLRIINCDGKTSWIKKAKVDKFVNTHHWNHPTQFTKKEIMLMHPYQCKCMSDDLDLMLWIRKNKYKVYALNKIVANFTVSGMSHTKSVLDIFDRIKTKTQIYMQNGYSIIHFFDVLIIEVAKTILDK